MSLDDFKTVKSLYFLPLNNEKAVTSKYYAKVIQTKKPDVVILDLEDAVPENFKETARSMLPTAVDFYHALGAKITVRINKDRIDELRLVKSKRDKISAVWLPKIGSIDEVESASIILENMNIGVFIESIDGLDNIKSIMQHPSIKLCIFGTEDLSSELGILTPTKDNMLYFASRLLSACVKNDVPVFGVLGEFTDYSEGLTEFRENLRVAKEVGFTGAFAIHEKQISAINETFNLTPEELSLFSEILQKAEENRNGIFQINNKMYGPPAIKKIKKIMEKHNAKP